MYWQEEIDEQEYIVPDDVVDLVFSMECKTLPVDHAEALSNAVHEHLPWFADEGVAGLHLVHGAESGNGWERPQDADELIYLSRRTKLILRLPREKVGEAREQLQGRAFEVAGHSLRITKASERLLSTESSQYARYVVDPHGEDEEHFLQEVVGELQGLGVQFKKILCGKTHVFQTREGEITTRSVIVAGLSPEHAVRLQEQGIGRHKKMGCGLFNPHKSV